MTRTPATVAVAALSIVGLIGLVASSAAGAPAERSPANVFRIADVFAGPSPLPVGSSTLTRTDRGVSVALETTALTPGDVVTMWLVVFNDPDGCQAGIPNLSRCGPDDAHAGRGGVSPNYGAGRVVGHDGTVTFGTHQRVGDTSWALAGPGLVHPRGTEVILVLKRHGPKIPHLLSDQLHTFAGGCTNQSDAPPGAPAHLVGRQGPNDCAEVQVSVHSPTP